MAKKDPKHDAPVSKKNTTSGGTKQIPISRSNANQKLDKSQMYMGVALVASSAFGAYLLATDKSLWLLAVSHAYGLLAICVVDVFLALLNFLSVRKVFVPSLVWAVLTVVLQIGDIATAPQYKMTVKYFARYLFGLWGFDALLLMQGIILLLGLSVWNFQKVAARKKRPVSYFDMGLKSSRRDFLQISGTIGIFVALAGALGVWSTVSNSLQQESQSSTNSQQNGSQTTSTKILPSGAVANVNDLRTGVPKYFDYPSTGYTNMLMKRSNGSVYALSILCTHVCCQCQYDNSTTDLYCPCHGSLFDQNGKVLNGPATTNLPSIQLRIDESGNIFPENVIGSGPCVQ